MRVSNHGKSRIVQRNGEITSKKEAAKIAKIAYNSGKTLSDIYKNKPLYNYLKSKYRSNECAVRVYKNNIYIYKGKQRTLVTSYGIPQQYLIGGVLV